jgi:hypothetical protein
LTYRFVPVFVLASMIPLVSAVAQAPNTAPAPAPQTQTAPPAATPAQTANVPDYPDPRTLTLGAFYWRAGELDPNIVTGRAATDYETLNGLGKVHPTAPGVEASYPITRTGSLHVEAFESKGTGNQTATKTTDVFTTTINTGDYLNTQYQIRDVKLYLDDLLFPHKFPVSRLRFKSIWAIEYLSIHSTANAPYVTAGEIADGTTNIILPVFGLAAEYAISKHVLFRLDGSGFGIYHRSDLWDAAATLSWRIGHVEVVAGGKALHFKSSPQKTEYQIGDLDGAFVGMRWHL